MREFDSYRGHDLRARREKLRKAMLLIPPVSAEDVPVIANTPNYFAFGNDLRPDGYWTDPSVMLAFQQDGYEKHLQTVDDDFVPYFMPWFGTGVLATAFGCQGQESRGTGDEPSVGKPAVHDVQEVAKLRLPDPGRDGWMPRVVRFMEYAARHGEIPTGLTDLNSPLSTALQVCGYENFLCWMYEEPSAVDDVMALITEAFIQWVRFQKQIIGEGKGWSYGLQGVYTPVGGVWLSDDDLVNIGPEFYLRFVMPHYNRIFTEFEGGHLHWCGAGTHQLQNIQNIQGLTTVNNSPMANKDAFRLLCDCFQGKKAIEVQDVAPVDAEAYYGMLFSGLTDLTGIIISTFVTDHLALNLKGETVSVDLPPAIRANAVVRAVRTLATDILTASS